MSIAIACTGTLSLRAPVGYVPESTFTLFKICSSVDVLMISEIASTVVLLRLLSSVDYKC